MYMAVRIRTGDGEPLALEEPHFPARCCPDLLDNELTGSVYELLQDRYGIEPARLHQELELTQLDSSSVAKLGVHPDMPVLRVSRIAWDVSGEPIKFVRGDIYRGDRQVFVADTDQGHNSEEGEIG